MSDDKVLREHLVQHLEGGQAHATFDQATEAMPPDMRGRTVTGMPHSAWQLLEHLRLAQWDILDFSRNPAYKTIDWPEDYWPPAPDPPTPTAWDHSVGEFHRDLTAMIDLVMNPATDLFARIPWGEGQTVLREALLVADHNAYHLGQLITLRRMLGAWTD